MDLAMSIASLSTSMAQQRVASDVNTALLGKALDMQDVMSDSLTKMMGQSVTPYLGGNIDISV